MGMLYKSFMRAKAVIDLSATIKRYFIEEIYLNASLRRY